jgi:4'-phosphopantetheinyl transferase
MRGNKLQKNALLARTLVRTTIARYQTNNVVDPRTLIFKKNMYGKPEVRLGQLFGITLDSSSRLICV